MGLITLYNARSFRKVWKTSVSKGVKWQMTFFRGKIRINRNIWITFASSLQTWITNDAAWRWRRVKTFTSEFCLRGIIVSREWLICHCSSILCTHIQWHTIYQTKISTSAFVTLLSRHTVSCAHLLLCVISMKLLYQLQSAFFYLLLHLAHARSPCELASNQRAKRNTRDCHALLHCANQSVSYSFRDTDGRPKGRLDNDTSVHFQKTNCGAAFQV